MKLLLHTLAFFVACSEASEIVNVRFEPADTLDSAAVRDAFDISKNINKEGGRNQRTFRLKEISQDSLWSILDQQYAVQKNGGLSPDFKIELKLNPEKHSGEEGQKYDLRYRKGNYNVFSGVSLLKDGTPERDTKKRGDIFMRISEKAVVEDHTNSRYKTPPTKDQIKKLSARSISEPRFDRNASEDFSSLVEPQGKSTHPNLRFTALVNDPDGTAYQINTRADGSVWVKVVLPGEGEEEDIYSKDELFVKDTEKTEEQLTTRDSASKIDIMLAYTFESMCDEAGESYPCWPTDANKQPIEDLILSGVAMNNEAFDNTSISTELNVVLLHLIVYAYAEPSSQDTILYDAQDGSIPDIHDLRDEYCADLVAIISTLGSGLGYVNSGASTAYTQTNKDYIAGRTLSHEIGHNFGCYHNPEDSSTSHAYAHGYRDPSEDFRTILAYGCDGSYCPRINYYSALYISYNREVIGDASHNCKRKISERLYTVANFRSSCSQSPVFPPIIVGPPFPSIPTFPSPIAPVIPTVPTIPTVPINPPIGPIAPIGPIYPTVPTFPIPSPSIPTIPSFPFPSFSLEGCQDKSEDWKDTFGDGCSWYEENDPGCRIFGESRDNNELSANEACCVCGGGKTGSTTN